MTAPVSQPIGLLILGMALAGCGSAGGPPPTTPDEAAGRRAALAELTVENLTSRALVIAFRRTGGPGGEVIVGHVAGAATAPMAPIPAGEPIVLIARDEQGAELALSPRSFRVGARWHWVIPADAAFAAREAPQR